MPKPNSSSTVAQMKAYIREHKVNHPEVRLGMKRGDMIAGLKKAGHWDDSQSKKQPPKTKKAPAKKKAVPKGSHRMPDGSIMKDKDMPKKASKNESPQRQKTTKKAVAPAKATTTDALFNLGTDISAMIGNLTKQEEGTYLASLSNIFAYTTGDKRVYDQMYFKVKQEADSFRMRGNPKAYIVKYNIGPGDTLQNIVLFEVDDVVVEGSVDAFFGDDTLPNKVLAMGNREVDRDYFLSEKTGGGRGYIQKGVFRGPHRITGTLNGKNYKYLRTWKFGVGAGRKMSQKFIPNPLSSGSYPAYWNLGMDEVRNKASEEAFFAFKFEEQEKLTKKQIQEKFNLPAYEMKGKKRDILMKLRSRQVKSAERDAIELLYKK